MNPIEKYFIAEKYESVLFVLVGSVALALSLYFLLKTKQSFYHGMAYPFIGIALIQLVVGTSVYFRSPKDIARVNQIVHTNSIEIQTDEIPRMQVVMKNFVLYRWIEIALISIGLLLFFIFPDKQMLKGVGLGLIIQASFMLILDLVAESRGKAYVAYLQQLIK